MGNSAKANKNYLLDLFKINSMKLHSKKYYGSNSV